MNLKQYGLEVKIDNIALKFFQMQGIKIATDLHPGNNTISSSSWRKPDWEAGSPPEGHGSGFLTAGIKQEKVTSHHPGPHREAETHSAEHGGLVMDPLVVYSTTKDEPGAT